MLSYLSFILSKYSPHKAVNINPCKRSNAFFSVIIAAYFCVASSTLLAQNPNHKLENISIEQGLSNNRIYSIFQDQKGFLWIGTLDGLNRYDGYEFKTYKNNPNDSLSISNNRASHIFQDSRGYLWISGKNTGLNRFDPRTETFKSYSSDANSRFYVPENNIKLVFEPTEGQIYAQSESGIYLYNESLESFEKREDSLMFKKHQISALEETRLQQILKQNISINYYFIDFNGNKWIAVDEQGVFVITNEGDLVHLANQELLSSAVRTIFVDRSGVAWIGTFNNGLFKYDPSSEYFTSYGSDNKSNFDKIAVRALCKDLQNNIWIGTYNDGLIKINPETGSSQNYVAQKNNPGALPSNRVRSIFMDKDKQIWVGTYKGLSKYLPEKNAFLNYDLSDPVDVKNEVPEHRVYDIVEDFYGNLWVANWDNLIRFNKYTEKIDRYPKHLFNMDNIRLTYIDNNNILWIGAEFGGLAKIQIDRDTISHISKHHDSKLPNHNVFDACEDGNGQLWVATFNGLNLLNRETGDWQQFSTLNGLPSNMIYGLMCDNKNNLWITTSNGLCKMNLSTKSVLTYNTRSGLHNTEFSEGAHFISEDKKEILVGGPNGFNSFVPENIMINEYAPKVVLTSLKLANKETRINAKINNNVPLTQAIEYSNSLVLTRKDKTITFEFAGLHFTSPQKNQYAYKLEGFNDEWIYTDASRRYATFTNLYPGDYIFKVKAANGDGTWTNEALSVNVKILPAIWETNLAFVFYGLVSLLLLLFFRYVMIKRLKAKNTLKLELIEREKSEEINKLKLEFFTNISHEFRTALSLILGPLTEVYTRNPEDSIQSVKRQLNIINRSTIRLNELVGQILDFRKMESNTLQLKVQKTDIIDFTRAIYVYYKELAKRKNLNLKLVKYTDSLDIWVDRDKYEKIIANLLSNAVKFTPKEGTIQIFVSGATNAENTEQDSEYQFMIGKLPQHTPYFQISITDSGKGIPKDLIEKIFTRFYQIADHTLAEKGTGIGLALVKQMVQMHQGKILVKSNTGLGTEFAIRFPIGKHLFSEQDFYKNLQDGQNNIELNPAVHSISSNETMVLRQSETSENNHAYLNTTRSQNEEINILVVDDHDDFREYIKSLLEPIYHVYEAENGLVGLEESIRLSPDIIITDLMMPLMDGTQLCKEIRANFKTSHIPLIILSAKENEETLQEGLESGANLYLTKPVEKELLFEKIKTLLDLRNKFNAFQLNKIMSPEQLIPYHKGLEFTLTPYDEKFLSKAVKHIEDNLTNSDFTVEEMSKSLGLSRTSLHNKLKAITNQSATEFIRSVRLKNAILMMKDGNMNVIEISYSVGFNTPSYFIKCFKKQFGSTPKVYFSNLKKQRQSNA